MVEIIRKPWVWIKSHFINITKDTFEFSQGIPKLFGAVRTEEPGRLQSMASRRVGHYWATSLSLFPFMHWRRKWCNPLQCSCLENPRDGGAWWAAVYGVAQIRKRLKRLSSSSSSSRNKTKTKYIFLIINHSFIAINSFTGIVCYYLFTYCLRLHLWQSCTLVRGWSSCDTVHHVFHLALYRRILLTFGLCQWFSTLVHIIIICHRIHHQEFLSYCFRIGTWASVVFKNLVGDYNMQSGLRITG